MKTKITNGRYVPNKDALAIAEIRHQTGLNYAECKKLKEEIDND
jgi:hypothetical protein